MSEKEKALVHKGSSFVTLHYVKCSVTFFFFLFSSLEALSFAMCFIMLRTLFSNIFKNL